MSAEIKRNPAPVPGPVGGEGASGAVAGSSSDVEVVPRAGRRKYTQTYKQRILLEADACLASGEVGALLRREGLYHATLSKWRKQRAEGRLDSAARPGRKPALKGAETDEVLSLRRELARIKRKLHQAEQIIAIQKKVSELLKIALPETPFDDEP